MLVQILKEKENALYPWKQSKIGHICVVSTKFSFFHQSATCHFFNCQITQLLQRHAVYLWTKHAYYGLLECAQKPSMKVWKGLFSQPCCHKQTEDHPWKRCLLKGIEVGWSLGFFLTPSIHISVLWSRFEKWIHFINSTSSQMWKRPGQGELFWGRKRNWSDDKPAVFPQLHNWEETEQRRESSRD